MNAPMTRLKDKQAEKAANRRKEPRYTSGGRNVIIRSSKGMNEDALVVDVSTHGCAVKTDADWLRNGSFVAVGMDDNTMQQAIVRWVRDGAAGMEFLRPIAADCQEWHELMDAQF